MKSQKSRGEVFECIDRMIKTDEDLEDSDLTRIIEAIDHELFEANKDTEKESKKHNGEERKMGLEDLEKWGEKIGSVSKQISNFCEENVDIAVDVLETIGKCHWAAVGFVLVASVLEKWHTVQHNDKECLRVLKSMNDLAKVVLELRPLPHETANTQAKIKESIHTILKGTMSCSKMMHKDFVIRLIKSGSDKTHLEEVRREIEELRSILHVHISVCIFKRLCEKETEFEGTKKSATSDQNEEVLDGKHPGNDTFTVADQTPSQENSLPIVFRDDSKKRRRSQDWSEPSYPPVTPSKREKVYETRTGIEGNTK